MMLLMLLIVLSLVVPRLPSAGRKIVIAISVIPVVFCLFYMIAAPGWVPGNGGRGLGVWRIVLFLGSVTAIVAGVGIFILR